MRSLVSSNLITLTALHKTVIPWTKSTEHSSSLTYALLNQKRYLHDSFFAKIGWKQRPQIILSGCCGAGNIDKLSAKGIFTFWKDRSVTAHSSMTRKFPH